MMLSLASCGYNTARVNKMPLIGRVSGNGFFWWDAVRFIGALLLGVYSLNYCRGRPVLTVMFEFILGRHLFF